MLNFNLTKKEESIKDVKVEGYLSQNSHKLVDFGIPIGGIKEKSRITTPDFQVADWPLHRSAREKPHGPGKAFRRTC